MVLSASRTKDLVRCCPEHLAVVLLGRAPCRFGLSPQERRLDPAALHTVVLWTKSTANLVACPELRAVLELLPSLGGQIALQLTVTGFGGTLLEPGLPTWREELEHLARALDAGLVAPEAVSLRWDPVATFEVPGVGLLSNARPAFFGRVARAAVGLGVRRFVASTLDLVRYPRAARRVADLGLAAMPTTEADARSLVLALAAAAHEAGGRFDVCCSPPVAVDGFGCVDGALYNRLLVRRDGPSARRCVEALHNATGRQRPRCRCTLSRDIGYSKGFGCCFPRGAGCVYCYAQGASAGRTSASVQAEVARLRADPSALDQPPYVELVDVHE